MVYIVAHNSFSKIHHILGHKTNLYNVITNETNLCILHDSNAIKHTIDSEQIYSKYTNSQVKQLLSEWQTCQIRDQEIENNTKQKIQDFLDLKENKN